MNFDLEETQALVQKTARDFADRELVPRAGTIDREGKIPKELGGAEAGVVSLLAGDEEIARGARRPP
jgi:alkylation response protein AidB-like acyl-CoA dehydrogenase